jgi:hypothetical protein
LQANVIRRSADRGETSVRVAGKWHVGKEYIQNRAYLSISIYKRKVKWTAEDRNAWKHFMEALWFKRSKRTDDDDDDDDDGNYDNDDDT